MIAMLRRCFQVPFSRFRSPAPHQGCNIVALCAKNTVNFCAFIIGLAVIFLPAIAAAQQPPEHKPFHALAFYTTQGEQDTSISLSKPSSFTAISPRNKISLYLPPSTGTT